jgi:hypothetical protein
MRVSVSRGASGSLRGNSTTEAVRVLHAGRRGWSDAVHGGAEGFGPDRVDELIRARTGQILTARVAALHAGWPHVNDRA